MDKLLFRRQFIMEKKPLAKFSKWSQLKINNNLFVTVHPDLEVEQYISESNSVTLLGYLIDPTNPQLSNYEIIKIISRKVVSFTELLEYTYRLSGRWVIIYNTDDETKLVNDPVGFREIYYTTQNEEIWCGSNPSILSNVLDLKKRNDQDLINFLNSEYFKKNENAWFGDKTIYENTYHLLPNHYLDIKTNFVARYWINKEETYTLEETTEYASEILEQSLLGANLRYDLALPITAGLDSRVLLSATKNISNDIYYYVSKMKMKKSHMDIRVPSKLIPKLGLELDILDNLPMLRKSFEDIVGNNIQLFRKGHPRNLTTQYYLDNFSNKVIVNGAVGEVGRNFFSLDYPSNYQVDSKYLMNLMKIPLQLTYVKKELDNWLIDAKEFLRGRNISIINLFYWEQRMGNWGCLTTNEEDVAIENFMPFNNRKLLMIIMSADRRYRDTPDFILYKRIAERLWPDVMSEPINPQSIFRKTYNKLIPSHIRSIIKKI